MTLLTIMVAIILLIQLRMWWLTQDTYWKIQCALIYLKDIEDQTQRFIDRSMK